MTTPVFMFPGQSSRYPEMMDRLVARAPYAALPVLELASEALNRDLRAHFRADNAEAFATNRDVQLGVFIANYIHQQALEQNGVRAELSLGLSLGEYNHLVHIGALEFVDALRVVNARGAAYDAGPEGAMASVFPLDVDELTEVVERVREHGPIEIANLNSPTQNVLSGARASIDAASAILEEEYSCECVMIEQKIPMHASIFRPAADALRPVLDAARWRTPSLPYLPNVLARFEEAPTSGRITELLCQHVYSPVRWRQSIDFIADLHPDAAFVEVGPRAVLYNLLSRKWRANARFKTDAPEGKPATYESTAKELQSGP
jgi:[acyl-carrier-protein] S-malonyltransferase